LAARNDIILSEDSQRMLSLQLTKTWLKPQAVNSSKCRNRLKRKIDLDFKTSNGLFAMR